MVELNFNPNLCCFFVENRVGLLILAFIEGLWLIANAVFDAIDFNDALYNAIMRMDHFRDLVTDDYQMILIGLGVITRTFSLLFAIGLAFSVFKRGSYKFLIYAHVAKSAFTIIAVTGMWLTLAFRPHANFAHPETHFIQAFNVVFDFLLPAYTIYVETRFLGEVAERERQAAIIFEAASEKRKEAEAEGRKRKNAKTAEGN